MNYEIVELILKYWFVKDSKAATITLNRIVETMRNYLEEFPQYSDYVLKNLIESFQQVEVYYSGAWVEMPENTFERLKRILDDTFDKIRLKEFSLNKFLSDLVLSNDWEYVYKNSRGLRGANGSQITEASY